MGINSTEVSYGFGQLGSVYGVAGGSDLVPPTNKVFVAITMIENTIFESSTGLISSEPTKYINTETNANDLAGGSETTDQGSGGLVVDSVTFPAGMTIFGRWTDIDVNTGKVIAYIGD
tara:strand:- start:170 stop:523 length:354 start_codon:yes stop_codon:yes gene_type:complete